MKMSLNFQMAGYHVSRLITQNPTVISGKSGELQSDIVEKACKKIAESLSDFELKNIFNMDEMTLFFKMLPDCSLTIDSKTKGMKKMKDCLSIAFAFDVLRIFVQIPMSPKKQTKKAWKTAIIFESWIRGVDCSMQLQKRNIILILNNATSHIVPNNLTNFKLLESHKDSTNFDYSKF